jgi:hypothetical protein
MERYKHFRGQKSALSVILIILTAVIVFAPAPSFSSGRGRVGQAPNYPTQFPLIEDTKLVMVGEPVVTLTGEQKAIISFKTAMPCPATRIYVGIFEPDQQLPLPRYRHLSKEDLKEYSTQHQVTIDLKRLMRKSVDVSGLKEKGGGIVAYRIEIYNPNKATACFYDRRFAFRDISIVPTIIEGPFVDMISETSAMISWDTDLPVSGSVHIDGRVIPAGNNTPTTHFEVDVTNLEPGKVYPYHAEISADAFATSSRDYSFRTPERDATSFTFAVMGDCRQGIGGGERDFGGVNLKTLRKFLIDTYHDDSDFIIITGDLVDGYTTSVLDFRMQLKSFKNACEPVGHYLTIYEVMGNHDVVVDKYDDGSKWSIRFDKQGDVSSEAIFADVFVNPTNGPMPRVTGAPTYKENVYYFDYGNSRFVVMNNNYWWADRPEDLGGNLEGYVLDDQFEWLKKIFTETAANPSVQHLFLAAQEPMFPNSGHTKDAMWYHGGDPDKNWGHDRTYVVERRDEIWQAFVETGKAVAGFFGDEHGYCRMLVSPDYDSRFAHEAWHIVSAGAGAPYYAQSKDVPWTNWVKAFSTQLNYALIKVYGQRVSLEARNFTGEIIDEAVLVE